MASEPLPLPEIWSDPPAGEGETARTELFANSRSSLVLIEYASGYAQQPDLQAFIRPVATPRQPAARERLPSLAPAALLKGLADLGSIVTQAEALLRAQGTLKSDAHFAVEHIHDVAMALRMRDVEAALCDTLDASVREVGDALVRHEAAATGAFSAAALLRDVMRRLEDLAVVAARISAADTEAPSRPSISEADAGMKPSLPVVSETVAREPVVGEEPHGADKGLEATFSTGPEEEAAQLWQAQAAEMPSARAVDVFAAGDEQVHASLLAASDGNDAIAADPLATNAAAAEAVSADAFATDTGAADTVTVETVEPDIVATYVAAADTVTADVDATATDTVATEIVVSDPVVSDTVAVDAGAADTVAVQTTATDSLAAEIVGSAAVATDVAAPATIPADTVVADAIATDPAPPDVSADPLVVSGSAPQPQAPAAPEDKVAAAAETTGPGLPYEESVVMPNGRETEPAVSVARGDDVVVVARGEEESAPTRKIDGTSAALPAMPTNDWLAVLYGLSEEELIALFS